MARRGRGRPPHPDVLTPAEWRVLEELRTGATYAEIAVRLGVSPDAIKFHVRNMRDKLGLEDRVELVAWKPPDGKRGKPFRAVLAPLATLPFATRTIAGVAVVAVAMGAVVAATVLVVALRDGGVPPIAVVVPDESPTTPRHTGTPVATPTPEATPAAAVESSPTPAPPGGTQADEPPPTTSPAAVGGDCSFDFRDAFHFWVRKPEYVEAPEIHRTPALRWIGHPPVGEGEPGTGVRVHRLIATGSVRGVERAENLSDGRAYLVLVIEVEEVLWGAVPQGAVVRILLDGNSREALDWERVEAAREHLLCSRALFANLWPVDHELVGGQSGELRQVSTWDIALGPRDDPFIDELAQAFRAAALAVQPRACPLFSIGTGSDVAVRPPRGGRKGDVESTSLDPASVAAVVKGFIIGIAGEASVTEHVSQGPLAERYLVFDVLVAESLAGELNSGDRLRLVLPVAATVSLDHVASLLPCRDTLLLLSEGPEEWLRVSLREHWVPLYSLHEWGLYLETVGGSILNPYVSWASWDWMLYGPMMIYGVNVQAADLAEFSTGLRGQANR